jgi:uncharacterized membrane protein
MKTFLIGYLGAAAAFIVLDAIWLNLTADRLYRAELGPLMRKEFDFTPVFMFYPLYLAGIVVFAVLPGVAAGGVPQALWRGALFGLIAYATYDLTNQATIAGWSWKITIADLIWGTFLTGSAAAAGAWAVRRFG